MTTERVPDEFSDMLQGDWLATLGPLLATQPGYAEFVGKTRKAAIIPARENTFAALRGRDPHAWKVVVIGQDPYPRAESACGIAFNDYKIKKWTEPLNPSLTNIAKSVLAHTTGFDPKLDIKAFRAAVAKAGVMQPPEWFEHTKHEGVLWLNTALTYESKEALKTHTSFWEPIIRGIFETLIGQKKAHLPNGLVVVMFGEHAQKLKTMITRINETTTAQPKLPLVFVDNAHPAATGPALDVFHAKNTFKRVDEALVSMGLGAVDWINKGPVTSTVAASNPFEMAAQSSTKRKMPEGAAAAPEGTAAEEPAAKTSSKKKTRK